MITTGRIRQLKSTFEASDTDGDGKLSRLEFLIASYAKQSDKDVISTHFRKFRTIDSDGDDRVTFIEVANFFRVDDSAREALRAAFNSIDSCGGGRVDFLGFLELASLRSVDFNPMQAPYAIRCAGTCDGGHCYRPDIPDLPECAPVGALTLFQCDHFNAYQAHCLDQPAIVIPAGQTVMNVTDFALPNGVSFVGAADSWINRTEEECVIYMGPDLTGRSLTIPPGGYAMNPPTIDGFSYRALSATAFSPVPAPVFTSPDQNEQTADLRETVQGTAASGVEHVLLYEGELLTTCPVVDGEWSYTPSAEWPLGQHALNAIAVRSDRQSEPTSLVFSVVVTVNITSPGDGSMVAPRTPLSGTAHNALTVEIQDQNSEARGSALVQSQRWTFTPESGEWATGMHSVMAIGTNAGANSEPDTVDFTVTIQNLTVESGPAGNWSGGQSGQIYSYDITMYAETRVDQWEIGFGLLPPGSKLDPSWVTNDFSWGTVIQDGSPDDEIVNIIIASPESGHSVPGGGSLPLRVRVIIPPDVSQDAYKVLYNLYAISLGADL
ncbi:EF-hand domain-containing protein [Streptomyces goshikiensis]|uniref:EF-hand domain-containing protein n=1 Tax=Streptomyces goshikiensis TaxID=1942 RepID=UPI0036873B98